MVLVLGKDHLIFWLKVGGWGRGGFFGKNFFALLYFCKELFHHLVLKDFLFITFALVTYNRLYSKIFPWFVFRDFVSSLLIA